MKAEVGDWIAFYGKGYIVISEVRYAKTDGLGKQEYYTSDGPVREDSVLETRKREVTE